MCGFVGTLDFGATPTDRSALERMANALAHRGPDGFGVDRSGPVSLAHRRLRVIDLSERADQPFWNERRDLAIVFNGEIYNFRELRAELERSGSRFRTSGDTEVVLELYAREGANVVDRLDGMFAFAIWDARSKHLFLARDRSGKKPLYFYEDGRRFVFASEIKAIGRHPGVSLEPNFDGLPFYLTFGYFPSPLTAYANVSSLAPATWMIVEEAGRRRAQRYWAPPYEVNGIRRLPEAVEKLRPLVGEAVRKRLISDVPLGAFLSGGLDSTVVVGLMAEAMRRPVKTFSIGFEGAPDYDEVAYAEEAAHRFGCDHTSFRVEPPGPDLFETLVRHHDGPFGDSSAIPTYIVSRLARGEVTVVLNGDGGDELFCGYSRLAACAISERIPEPVRRVAALGGRLLPAPRSHASTLRRVRQFLEVSARPFRERIQAWCSFFSSEELEGLLRQPGPRVDASEHFETVLQEVESGSPLARALYLNYRTYLPEDLLVKMDRMTMAHGLEARSPLLDVGLTEFVGSLPDSFKLSGFTTKVILREAFRDLVPRSILERRKMGFGVPLGAWFRGGLRPLVDDHLASPGSKLFELVDRDFVQALVAEHMEGQRDRGQQLFCLLTLSLWLRSL